MTRLATIANNSVVRLAEIPLLAYDEFLAINTGLLQTESKHCVSYFGLRQDDLLKVICAIADDDEATITISSAEIEISRTYPSLTAQHAPLHIFERILHESFGVRYSDHPWLKPVRYPSDRSARESTIEQYPFYQIHSEDLHEVGVGPIHAGIIEPGHFRFICNGEQILHLEIQLGYQHRGVESLLERSPALLQRTLLAESIAGDSVAGHTVAFVNAWEALCGFQATREIQFARTLALELERIAVHTGDLSAICADIGYQLGSAVFARLRTPIINFLQEWCGNRLGKGMIRPGMNPWYFTEDLASQLARVLAAYERDLQQMWNKFHDVPPAMARLEKTGVVSRETAKTLGSVGMAARASGIARDIRVSHPHDIYRDIPVTTVVKHHGDVYSRTQLRFEEIVHSIGFIRTILATRPEKEDVQQLSAPAANSLAISLSEGWRGEICHCIVTGAQGEIVRYVVKDPSLHNWPAVAMAVRNNEISDFPVCNKSFNLSYCGHDL